jgi:hypothetical protein
MQFENCRQRRSAASAKRACPGTESKDGQSVEAFRVGLVSQTRGYKSSKKHFPGHQTDYLPARLSRNKTLARRELHNRSYRSISRESGGYTETPLRHQFLFAFRSGQVSQTSH